MCFSAGASFGAGIILAIVGAGAIKEAKAPSQLMFAAIPLVFSIQQIIEGMVWLSFTNPAFLLWREQATYGFLVFAQVIWPAWVPLAILLMEKEKRRIRILEALSVLGIMVSVYLAFCLFSFPVRSEAANYHIAYFIDLPASIISDKGLFYIIVTVLSPFVSSTKKMWIFGLTILLSYLLTKFFFSQYVISVWCFFAAITSGTVFYILQRAGKSAPDTVIEYS